MARLKSEDGAAFEADYIAAQTKGHQDAVGLFAGYAKGGDNKVMQAFAKKTLPIIEMHLRMCYALAAKKK
jgi:putative membrane protein